MGVLEQALAVALDFKPLPPTDAKQLLARTAPAAGEGKYEKFKTSTQFDGTTHNPKWLETAKI
jgi:uncharacterized protein